MTNFITSYSVWRELYKKSKYNIWFHIYLNNNIIVYLRNYNEWFDLKNYCETNKISICKIQLRYRSHIVTIDTNNSDGVYLVKSLLGRIGGQGKDTITVGILKNNIVKKNTWLIPELIIHHSDEDNIDKCFPQCIIYNEISKSKTAVI